MLQLVAKTPSPFHRSNMANGRITRVHGDQPNYLKTLAHCCYYIPYNIFINCECKCWHIKHALVNLFCEKSWYCSLPLSALFRRREPLNLRYSWCHDVRQQCADGGGGGRWPKGLENSNLLNSHVKIQKSLLPPQC